MSNLSVDFNFDGVPALRAQIEQGAYADVIVSANLKHMDALRSEGYMDNNTVEIFAGNKVAVIVPDEYNVVGKFPLGVLLQSRHPEEAQSFIDLVMSDEGQAILGKYGFIPVDEVQKS
jgi:ABC-type molybdate transport system substrate-binding protein